MRFVPQIEVWTRLPNDWDQRVLNARQKVWSKMIEADLAARKKKLTDDERRAAVAAARAKAITSQSTLWSDLGKLIRDIENQKCWYCEMDQIRSDMPVDHFRPKNRVAECKEHPGYHWLAFDWENYRFSCTFCNSRRVDVKTSGGKQDHFPLVDPNARRMGPKDTTIETPMLLDPCKLDDTRLLTFHKNGLAASRSNEKESTEYKRVHKSIELYHLNHDRLETLRTTIAKQILDYVGRVERIEAQAAKTQNDEDDIVRCKTEIIMLVRNKANLCTAARIYLEEFKNIAWVADIISRDF